MEVGGVEPPSKSPFSVRLRVYPTICLSGLHSPAGGFLQAVAPLSFAFGYGESPGLAFFFSSSHDAKGRAAWSLSHLSSESVVLVAS